MIAPKIYRERPREVEAVQWDGEVDEELERWLGDTFESWVPGAQRLVLAYGYGEKVVGPGSWFVKYSGGFISNFTHSTFTRLFKETA